MGQKRPIEAYRRTLQIPAQVLLKSATGKAGVEYLVLAKEKKKYRRAHADGGDRLPKRG